MKAALLIMLSLSGCNAPFPPVGAHSVPAIPEALRACPKAPEQAPVPTPPRTFASVVAYANANEDQRAAAVQALEICRHKLIELIAWADEHIQ